MKPLKLQSAIRQDHTSVPNTFLDTYMPNASGEFVKIYIYILRCLCKGAAEDNCSSYRNGCVSYSGSADCFCVSFLADKLNLMEKDVIRALKYWEKEGLLKLTYSAGDSGKEELAGITVIESPTAADTVHDAFASATVEDSTRQAQTKTFVRDGTVPQTASSAASAGFIKPSYTASQLKQFAADEELEQLLYIAQKYIGKTLSPSETGSIIFFYDTLKMPPDMIEYLLEYCISTGHKSMRYIEKVAISWAEEGLKSIDEVKQRSMERSGKVYSVLDAFGIRGRGAAKVEQDYIRKWNDSYCFTSDIIIEACNRTIQAIHQPSFEYADKILAKWKERGIKSIEDIKELDEEFEKIRTASARSSTRLAMPDKSVRPNGKAVSNRFNNFSQRDYDYEELEKDLLKKGLV